MTEYSEKDLQKVGEIVSDYDEALQAGKAPKVGEILKEHPRLAPALEPQLLMAWKLHETLWQPPANPERDREFLQRLPPLDPRRVMPLHRAGEEAAEVLFRTGRELLLLMLGVPGKWSRTGDAVEGLTRLMKTVFLVQMTRGLRGPFIFEPGEVGPFAKAIYEDLRKLKKDELIGVETKAIAARGKEKPLAHPPSPRLRRTGWQIELTEKGKHVYGFLLDRLREQEPDLAGLLRWAKGAVAWTSPEQVLQSIERDFPQYAREAATEERLAPIHQIDTWAKAQKALEWAV